MKIISTNVAKPVNIRWNGKDVTTGIYKTPLNQPIYLAKNEVLNDEISDRKNHGGYYKACYLFSAEQYPYWKELYPNLDWSWGMFGENLTLSNFDERSVFLGEIYKIGEAVVQVSQSREPCYKLAYKFGTPQIVKQFIERGFSGTYLSIIEEGYVAINDEFSLIERPESTLSVFDLFNLLFAKTKNREHLKIAVESKAISKNKRIQLSKYLNKL